MRRLRQNNRHLVSHLCLFLSHFTSPRPRLFYHLLRGGGWGDQLKVEKHSPSLSIRVPPSGASLSLYPHPSPSTVPTPSLSSACSCPFTKPPSHLTPLRPRLFAPFPSLGPSESPVLCKIGIDRRGVAATTRSRAYPCELVSLGVQDPPDRNLVLRTAFLPPEE